MIVARLNYLSSERPDIPLSTEEVARTMSCPRQSCSAKAKQLARYLAGRPRVFLNFAWRAACKELSVYTDSDWAGCVKSRKSISGGAFMIGLHLLKTYSRQQRTIALNGAEAELYALVAASAAAMGLVAYDVDLSIPIKSVSALTLAPPLALPNAAGWARLDTYKRRSVGCNRHMLTRFLSADSLSDVPTKYAPGDLLDKHMRGMSMTITGGRVLSAPTSESVCTSTTSTSTTPTAHISGTRLPTANSEISLWDVSSLKAEAPLKKGRAWYAARGLDALAWSLSFAQAEGGDVNAHERIGRFVRSSSKSGEVPCLAAAGCGSGAGGCRPTVAGTITLARSRRRREGG